MAQERPVDWSETKFRYWYLHHLHHKVKHKWRDAKDFIGVTVEYMRSPSGTDSWHSRKGYTGVPKAVEGFLHEKTSGSSTVGAYQLNIGLNTSITGDGWNAGTWGRGTWNSATTPTVESVLRLWTHDNFGEDLIINIFNGGLYYYDSSAGLTNRAVVLSSVAGAVSPPSVAVKVLVSDVDLHVIAFGCDSEDDPGTQDPLLIRFSDQRNALDWKATVDNTAGDLKISSGSKIITAIETKREILVFTDTSI